MNRHYYALSVVLAASLAAPSAALASFRVDDPNYRPPVHPSPTPGHIGVPDKYRLVADNRLHHVIVIGHGHPKVVSGFGHSVPLSVGFQMLLPNEWVAYTAPNVDDSTMVTWHGKQTWLSALKRIATRNSLQMFVDFNQKILRVENMPESATQKALAAVASTNRKATGKSNTAPAAETTKPKAPAKVVKASNTVGRSAKGAAPGKHDYGSGARPVSSSHSAAPHSAPKPVAPHSGGDVEQPATHAVARAVDTGPHVKSSPDVFFEIKKGVRLSRPLAAFVKKHNWQLAWNSPRDIPIEFSVGLHGKNFKDVLDKVCDLFHVHIKLFYGNRVVAVSLPTSASVPIEGQ